MKCSIRFISLMLALMLLFTALPLTAHAQDSYPQPGSVNFHIRQEDGTFSAVWKLDYTGLDDSVSVLHTLEFYRSNRYTTQKMFELEQAGRVNEVDLTEYKEWYFGNTEWSYSVQLTTQYIEVENGTTYTKTMQPVKSSSGILFDLKMPEPTLTAVEPAAYHEGDPAVEYDVSWENLQDDCLLQFTLTVNDDETKQFRLYPDDEDLPVDATRTFFMPVTELETPLKEGDRVRCEVQIYRMVTDNHGAPAGDPFDAEFVVQAPDPNVPKITGASYPILRAGAKTLRLSVTWEHMPLTDRVMALAISVNGGEEQRFEVSPEGDYAVAEGTRSFELSAAYLNKTLKAGDQVHTELTFIRDSDGTPLSMPYSFDAVVKPATEMNYEVSGSVVARYSATGEQKEFVVSSYDQLSDAQAQAKEWLISKGAQADAVGTGNSVMSTAVYGDGVQLPGADYYSILMSDEGSLYDTITIVYETAIFCLDRCPAVWGDVDRDGDVTALDVTWLLRHAAEMNTFDPYGGSMNIPFDENDFKNGDVDQNGETNVIDATLIQHWMANMQSDHPIGESIPTEA